MTVLTSITDILKGQVYMPTIYKGDSTLEITVGDFEITGTLEIDGYDVAEEIENDLQAFYEVISQSFTTLSIYDTEACENIEFSKSDADVINAWFQLIKLEIWL